MDSSAASVSMKHLVSASLLRDAKANRLEESLAELRGASKLWQGKQQHKATLARIERSGEAKPQVEAGGARGLTPGRLENWVAEPEGLTCVMLTEALRGSGVLGKDHTVKGIASHVLEAGAGYLSKILIIDSVDYDGEDVPAGAPAKLVVKFGTKFPPSQAVAQFMGLYKTEGSFYLEAAHRINVRMPLCYGVAVSEDGAETMIVMENINQPDLYGGDQVKGCTVTEAKLVLLELAKFHAYSFGRCQERGMDWAPPFDAPHIGPQQAKMFADGLKKVEGICPPHLYDDEARELVALIAQYTVEEHVHRCMQGPQVVGHGDLRLDNVFFQREQGAAEPHGLVMYDFQILNRGGVLVALHDLTYFLGGNMDTDLFVSHEEELLQAYYDTLTHAGADFVFSNYQDFRSRLAESAVHLLTWLIAMAPSVDLSSDRAQLLVEVFFRRTFAFLKHLKTDAFLRDELE
eukprot:CAMPEP_0119135586 /NCGR_PEP_ID=MMETSP1310-20130426/19600_1 /TAXON_ID=464262 /ORGANISM="Genus nov. species nov., Strain RCC2339" /LENGTH=460 /DNA_ID=CAMNT_0007126487 /DNA_START=51 /DNA_END=1433 /DNA_ORIENTATION=+